MTRRSDHTVILVLTALAMALRVWGLNTELWLDEIVTLLQYMRLPPLEAASTFNTTNQHLLNSVLGSLSIRALGESAWTVRLPALLFGLATIPVFFKLARAVTVRREAVLATLFLTLSYHHVWFSQNARGYTAMIFFAVLSTLFLVRALESGRRRRDWLWFGVWGGLGMLSLLNYAFVLVSQFLTAPVIIAGKREWSVLRALAGSGVLVLLISALGFAATLPAMIDYFSQGGADKGWQNPLAFARVFATGLTSALPAMAVPALAGGALVALTGWFSYCRQQRVIALMLVLPAALNVLALAVLDFGAFPRAFLYILPFGILVLIRGAFVLSTLARRSIRFLRQHEWLDHALPVMIVVGATAMLPYNYLYPKQDYSRALQYARNASDKTDVIAAVGYLASAYRTYYAPELEFPADATELAALSDDGGQVWVLYSFTRDMRRDFADIQDYIDAHYERRRVFPGTLGDGAIYVVVSRD